MQTWKCTLTPTPGLCLRIPWYLYSHTRTLTTRDCTSSQEDSLPLSSVKWRTDTPSVKCSYRYINENIHECILKPPCASISVRGCVKTKVAEKTFKELEHFLKKMLKSRLGYISNQVVRGKHVKRMDMEVGFAHYVFLTFEVCSCFCFFFSSVFKWRYREWAHGIRHAKQAFYLPLTYVIPRVN